MEHPALSKLAAGAAISADRYTVIFGVLLPPASGEGKPDQSFVLVKSFEASGPPCAVLGGGPQLSDKTLPECGVPH